MAFWLFMFFMALLLPLSMILIGQRFIKHPPKKANNYFGYRSPRSMRNQDTWDFASLTVGKLWRRLGWVSLPPSVLAMLLVLGKEIDVIGRVGWVACMTQFALMLVSIFLVESALKRNFDENGNRRDVSET
jgi:uncharacterized membrane protein